MKVLGIYRESEFSPGKVEADAAILDEVLAELGRHGFETYTMQPARLDQWSGPSVDLVLAMCQGTQALRRLSGFEQSGAIAINPALGIRNCYRDLLNAGLARAGIPIPPGVLVETAAPLAERSMLGLQLSLPLYVKRGDLHALGPDDVTLVENIDGLRGALAGFARRGVGQAYIQHAIEGAVVKFYGVSGGEYFSALPEDGELPEAVHRDIAQAAAVAASAIGLETWGGDAIVDSDGGFRIVDFNDWPSYSRVRAQAARAIARRAMWLLQRARLNASRAGSP